MQEQERDNDQVRQRLQELLDLYGELVMTCQLERVRVAGELRQLNQPKQIARVYKLFG